MSRRGGAGGDRHLIVGGDNYLKKFGNVALSLLQLTLGTEGCERLDTDTDRGLVQGETPVTSVMISGAMPLACRRRALSRVDGLPAASAAYAARRGNQYAWRAI